MMANPAIGWTRQQNDLAVVRRQWRQELRPGIERDTGLMPWVIADSVIYEASCFLDADLPLDWADWLDQRAERCYAKRAHFRQLVRRKDEAGRNNLYRFFRHWLASRLRRERLGLFRRLPKEYCFGAALRGAGTKR